jgi:hypothetical protein
VEGRYTRGLSDVFASAGGGSTAETTNDVYSVLVGVIH